MVTTAPTQLSMQTPTDLFVHELSDTYSAEQLILQMLQDAQGLVQNPTLAQGLQTHFQQTQQHVANLEQVFQQLGQQPHPVVCHAAAGLRQSLLEGAVVGGACKTEHLEIAAYTGLITKATVMGHPQVAQLLMQNLQDEEQTLQQLETIGQQLAQQMAAR
jgi:ferritin-like metal-binding protein YciE